MQKKPSEKNLKRKRYRIKIQIFREVDVFFRQEKGEDVQETHP